MKRLWNYVSSTASAKWRGPPVIDDPDGDDEDFSRIFSPVEKDDSDETVLGEGEFGVVKLVRARDGADGGIKEIKGGALYAVKMLRKGYQLKDNVVYGPPIAGVLQREVSILRTLGGNHHTLKLFSVYEGFNTKFVYLVTELCDGDLSEYRTKLISETQSLSVEDVSAVARALLDAVDHCARNGVIHRDIKHENVMFFKDGSGCSGVDAMRLIDFGSGALDGQEQPTRHKTYAGSAFFNSPEMFNRSYTYKTDVWSAGVTIFVFAFGYPTIGFVQESFDEMHNKAEDRKLNKGLPKHTAVGADSVLTDDKFWDMLDNWLLVYRHMKRKSAGEALEKCSFLALPTGNDGGASGVED